MSDGGLLGMALVCAILLACACANAIALIAFVNI